MYVYILIISIFIKIFNFFTYGIINTEKTFLYILIDFTDLFDGIDQ